MKYLICFLFLCQLQGLFAQRTNQTGAWYMYFYNHEFKESNWGIQGDLQYRNWNIVGDLEQLLIRSGVTYSPKGANIKFTLGAAHVSSGDLGTSNDINTEFRIYQEALFPQKIGNRVYVNHRFRYEQRFVENQDFRTRYRYNIFINVPINGTEINNGVFYVAFYNELFINAEQDIGNGVTVDYFDRNRTYFGIGKVLTNNLNAQFGWMNQKTNNFAKGQLQVSLHHKF